MIPFKCYKCETWLHEVTVKKLDHHLMTTYVCYSCGRGYEVIK